MKQMVQKLLFLGLFLFAFLAVQPIDVEGKTLIVYDTLDYAEERQQNVDTLQRLLTSLNESTETISAKDYSSGKLQEGKYDRLISFVQREGFHQTDFLADRAQFTKQKMHIGPHLTEDEKSQFNGAFRSLAFQQLILQGEEDYYEEQLPFQEHIEVFEGEGNAEFGRLRSVGSNPKIYSYGVLQEQAGYLPLFSSQGAVYLQSVKVLAKWYGKAESYLPVMVLSEYSPLIDLAFAQDVTNKLASYPMQYILSTTSVSQNNDSIAYKRFTDFLYKVQRHNRIFLRMPYVENEGANQASLLKEIVSRQISLMIDRNILPTGLAAEGYWNQQEHYQRNGLADAKTLLLAPTTNEEAYRKLSQTENQLYDQAIVQVDHKELEQVVWKKPAEAYRFTTPTAIAYTFPTTEKQATQLYEQLDKTPFPFTSIHHQGYRYGLQTATQTITDQNGRLALNDTPIGQFASIEDTEIPSLRFQGSFARFFNLTNTVLIVIVVTTIAVIVLLFLRGRRNYRAKYIRKETKNDDR